MSFNIYKDWDVPSFFVQVSNNKACLRVDCVLYVCVCVCDCVCLSGISQSMHVLTTLTHTYLDHTHIHTHTHTSMPVLTTLTHMKACTDHTHVHTLCRGVSVSAYSAAVAACCLCPSSLPTVTTFSAVQNLHKTRLQKMGAKPSTLGSPILLVTMLNRA